MSDEEKSAKERFGLIVDWGVTRLLMLSQEERLAVIRSFCVGCGSEDTHCHCRNDE